jgi:hypothetical protein
MPSAIAMSRKDIGFLGYASDAGEPRRSSSSDIKAEIS